MVYKYLLENNGNVNLEFNDICNKNGICFLNILCYHIDTERKYPFLQFMMDKVPYCNNIVKEQLTIPTVILRNSFSLVKDVVLERVKSGLSMIGCDFNKVVNEMYKGIIFIDDTLTPYALVNITGIDIYGLNFMRQTTTWFVLPSEIINSKKVFNIEVDCELVKLFIDNPNMGLLNNTNNDDIFMLPDAVYTSNEIKKAEFCSIFGNYKTKAYDTCGEYYFFNRSFENAVKYGGFLKDNQYCINRYALFFEGKIHLTTDTEILLTDDVIENQYPEPCIIICYFGKNIIKPDILVKNYESFACLSYHNLNKKILDETNKDIYTIA